VRCDIILIEIEFQFHFQNHPAVIFDRMRKVLLKIHLVLGLVCGLFIVVMGLSGSVLVFRAELERQFLPQVTVRAAPDQMALQPMVDRFREQHPESKIRSITLPFPGTSDAVVLAVTEPKSGPARVYLDPASGKELGRRTNDSDWLAWVTNLHHTLFGEGHSLTGPVGAVFSIMCLTGIFVWWPGRNLLARDPAISPTYPGRFGARETHRLIGFWSFVVLFVLAFTGTVFTWRDAYNRAAGAISGAERPAIKIQAANDATGADLDRALESARAAVPNGFPTSVRPAAKPGDPVVIRMKTPDELRKVGSTSVYLDGTLNILKVDRLAEAAWAYRFVDAMTPVHFGEVGGGLIKAIWALAGVLPTVLFISGVRIWWRSLAAAGVGVRLKGGPTSGGRDPKIEVAVQE
jgi:uncharacterized iron-regulated membrane protein